MSLDQSDANQQLQSLGNEAKSSWARFKQSGMREDIDSAIHLQKNALDSCSLGHPERGSTLYNLALFLHTRYQRWGDLDDLESAILLNRDALELRPEGHPIRYESLVNLASSVWTRFGHRGRMEDLEEAIALNRDALTLQPEGHPGRSLSLCNLASSLETRFEHVGEMEDLEEATRLHRAVLELQPEDHPLRSISLGNLANSLGTCFEHYGRLEDLEEAITLGRAVMELEPEGHPDRSLSLCNLATSLGVRFESCGNLEDLEEAIMLERVALDLRPEGHPDRSASLCNLAISLATRFEHCGRIEDLDEAIKFDRDALELRPEGHPDRSRSLGSLANSLRTCFELRGRMEDLEEAITLNRTVLELQPEGHPLRSVSLYDLAINLRTCFQYHGRVEDLEEAIALHRAALELRKEGHPGRSASLASLANSLRTRFGHRGRVEDLEEAIALDRAALKLRQEGHRHRPQSLGNLAMSLKICFEYRARMEDLEEAISLERAALELRPEGHPDRSLLMGSLSTSLGIRFQHHRRLEDLEEAIALDRAALKFRPEGDPDRSFSFSNLANSLLTCFEHHGRIEDLEEAITLYRTALNLCPHGRPDRSLSLYNLATSLRIYFQYQGKMEDLEEAISMNRAALKLQPEGHPLRSLSLVNLAECLHVRSQEQESINDSVESLNCAAVHSFSSFSTRLVAVHRWVTIARSHGHPTLLEAHRIAMGLLQRALTVRPTLSAQHKFLSSDIWYQSLALDAASHAIDKRDFTQAIELLEQGRALLWSQMRGLRTPLDQLSEFNKALAERFESCNHHLELLIASSESRTASSGTDVSRNHSYSAFQEQNTVEEKLVLIRRLSEEQEAMINDIRRIPGFESFLRAAPFEKIQQAASEGPVIMLNFSKYRSDALIVLSSKDLPCVCVPLDQEFYSDSVALHKQLLQVRKKPGVGSKKYDGILRRVMKVLWDRVVSKVVQKLKEIRIVEGSRIWWCPTSVLTAFPFHAAGPYKGSDGKMKYLLDYYISSYTPTLMSLINARPDVQDGDGRMLFVGDTRLPSAIRERHAISRIRRIDEQLLDKRASPDMVISSLRRVEWVHFVCHGLLAKEPFDSSLKLQGGKLTLLDIARARLPNAEFAFLSACHTAEQRPTTVLDESLHLAAAMQFCGFRSVIGMMWQLLDQDGPFLTGNIYTRLMVDLEGEGGEMRYKRAAAAVREAALSLRERKEDVVDGKQVDIMVERWVNLVHIGV